MTQREAAAQTERRLRLILAKDAGNAGLSDLARWRVALTLALFTGDSDRAISILGQATREIPAIVTFDEILAPAMHNIGTLWAEDEITVADEHAATAIAHRLIDAVAEMLWPPEAPVSGSAVLAVPPSDRHTGALLMAEAVLRSAGYRVVFLGCDLPLPELSAAVARHVPTVVGISATMINPAELDACLRSVVSAAPDARVLLGGTCARFASPDLPVKALPGMQALMRELCPERFESNRTGAVPAGRRQIVTSMEARKLLNTQSRGEGWINQIMSPESDAERTRRALLDVAEEVSHSATWMWDTASGHVVWSDNVFRVLDLEPAETPPSIEDYLLRVHPDDRAMVAAHLADPEDMPTSRSYRVLTSRGLTRFVTAVTAITLSRPGGPVLVGWLLDITESQRVDRQIAAHIAVTDVLRSWESLEQDAVRLLSEMARALGFSRAVLWVPSGPVLVPRAHWEQNDPDTLGTEICELRLRKGEGLAGRAWEHKAPETIRDFQSERGSRLRSVALSRGLRGACAFPLINSSEVIAAITLAGPDVVDLDDRLKATIVGIGHEIGSFFGGRISELRGSVLSVREVEVLQLAAQGLAGPEIARRLHLSPATVKTHFENIYGKYGVTDRVSAVARALREGLIR